MKTFLLVLSAYRPQTIEELNPVSTASILRFGISLINRATQSFHIKVMLVKAQTQKLQCVKSPRLATECLVSTAEQYLQMIKLLACKRDGHHSRVRKNQSIDPIRKRTTLV